MALRAVAVAVGGGVHEGERSGRVHGRAPRRGMTAAARGWRRVRSGRVSSLSFNFRNHTGWLNKYCDNKLVFWKISLEKRKMVQVTPNLDDIAYLFLYT
jgi:hypothetical protein